MSLPGYSLIVNPLSMSSTANDTASALQTFGDNIVQSGVALVCETLLYGACSTLQALNILTKRTHDRLQGCTSSSYSSPLTPSGISLRSLISYSSC